MGVVVQLVTAAMVAKARDVYLSSWDPRHRDMNEFRLQKLAQDSLVAKLKMIGIERVEDAAPGDRADLYRWLIRQRRTDEALGPAAAHDATS